MPTWLFWKLAEGVERDRVQRMADIYQATGASGPGFTPESSKPMIEQWNAFLARDKTKRHGRKRSNDEWFKMSREDRMAAWFG